MAAVSDRPLALVTGSSSGIGWAYSERLAADGHDLIVVARRGDRLTALKELLEARHEVEVTPLVADLSTEAGIASLDAVVQDPRLTTVVDSAALAYYKPFVELPEAELTELVMLNALAPARLMRSALPAMVKRGGGTVVTVASLLAFSGGGDNPMLPRRAVYAATKSFLLTLVRVLAAELADTGVRLQVLCPGVVKTEFHTRQGMDLSGRPRMEPADVVQASLRGLELGELICIPTLPDRDALDAAAGAEAGVLTAGMNANLARRYLR